MIPEPQPWYQPILLPIYVAWAIAYGYWRIVYTVDFSVWFTVPLLMVEIYTIFMTLVYLWSTRKLLHPKWLPPLKNKTVDIFIPTYNEPVEIVEMTAIGAKQVSGRHKVFILDDGHRAEIAKLAKELGVEYISRPDNKHAKAGNLNYALPFSKADFILCLDCDHVPMPNFIERTLGYFINPNLGFVQTPQVFYNFNSIQHRPTKSIPHWNEQTMFYESIQLGKNAFNSAFFCGSGGLWRRQAIDDIGGFATDTATEDIHSALRAHRKGWDSLYVNEKLAFGLAPDDLKEYYRQRVRWGAGSVGLLFRSPDSPLVASGLSWAQRLNYFASMVAHMQGNIKLFYFILPLYVLISGYALLDIPLHQFLMFYLPFLGYSLWITRVYSHNTFDPLVTEQYNIANILGHMVALKAIFKIDKKFGVSIKVIKKPKNGLVYHFLLITAGLMVLGNIYGIYYWATQGQFSLSYLDNSSIGMGMFWNSLNLAMVLPFVGFMVIHPRRRKPLYPFNIHQNSILNRHTVLIRSMGLTGCELISPTSISNKGGSLKLTIDGQSLSLKGKVEFVDQHKKQLIYNFIFDGLSTKYRQLITLYAFHQLVPNVYRGKVNVQKIHSMNQSTKLATTG